MNKSLRIFILITILAVLIILGIWITPRILALYYELKGGQLMDLALSSEDFVIQEAIACSLIAVEDESAQTMATQAISHLQTALSYNPNLDQANLLLGRAYCLTGQPVKAVQAYLTYTRLRPENPLGHLELGLAYEAACRQKEDGSINNGSKGDSYTLCQDLQVQDQILEEWKKAGITPNQFIAEGKKAFAGQQYENAVHWFQRAAIFGEWIPSPVLFQWSVAAIITGHPIPDMTQESEITIYSLNSEETQIEGENLQWVLEDPNGNLSYGDKLIKIPGGEPSVGIMWWAGKAIAFVEVPEEKIYRIYIRTKDTPPGPIKLQVEKDFTPIDKFVMDKGDMNWQEMETATILSPGVHLIGINFLEDNGDAAIDWIRIQTVK